MVTLAEEIAIALVVLLVLPRFGINLPLPVLIGIMSGLAVYGFVTYRCAKRVLEKEPLAGLPYMVGTRGRVVQPLCPWGVVKINNELWEATSEGDDIDVDREIVVVKQRGLKLTVRCGGGGRG